MHYLHSWVLCIAIRTNRLPDVLRWDDCISITVLYPMSSRAIQRRCFHRVLTVCLGELFKQKWFLYLHRMRAWYICSHYSGLFGVPDRDVRGPMVRKRMSKLRGGDLCSQQ